MVAPTEPIVYYVGAGIARPFCDHNVLKKA